MIILTSILVFFYLKPFEAIFGAVDRALDHILGSETGGASIADGAGGARIHRGSSKGRGAAGSGGGSAWASSTKTSFGAVR